MSAYIHFLNIMGEVNFGLCVDFESESMSYLQFVQMTILSCKIDNFKVPYICILNGLRQYISKH